MLRNLKSQETYFQAAFRVHSPWSIKNPNGDNPNEEEILKPVCFVFDFAPTRALRQLSEYGIGLSPGESNPENAAKDHVSFLPVLAYGGSNMTQIAAVERIEGWRALGDNIIETIINKSKKGKAVKNKVKEGMLTAMQNKLIKLEPDLFQTVTGLTVKDFHLLVRLKVFNTEQMNQAVFHYPDQLTANSYHPTIKTLGQKCGAQTQRLYILPR